MEWVRGVVVGRLSQYRTKNIVVHQTNNNYAYQKGEKHT